MTEKQASKRILLFLSVEKHIREQQLITDRKKGNA